jgi:hypothetical protein
MPTYEGRRRSDSERCFFQNGRGDEVFGYLPVRQKEMASSGQEEEASLARLSLFSAVRGET